MKVFLKITLFLTGVVCGAGATLVLIPEQAPCPVCQCETAPQAGTCLIIKDIDECESSAPVTQEDIERIKNTHNEEKQHE